MYVCRIVLEFWILSLFFGVQVALNWCSLISDTDAPVSTWNRTLVSVMLRLTSNGGDLSPSLFIVVTQCVAPALHHFHPHPDYPLFGFVDDMAIFCETAFDFVLLFVCRLVLSDRLGKGVLLFRNHNTSCL